MLVFLTSFTDLLEKLGFSEEKSSFSELLFLQKNLLFFFVFPEIRSEKTGFS